MLGLIVAAACQAELKPDGTGADAGHTGRLGRSSSASKITPAQHQALAGRAREKAGIFIAFALNGPGGREGGFGVERQGSWLCGRVNMP